MQCSPMVLMYERPGYYSIILFHRIKTELYHIPVLVKHSNIVNVCSSFFIQLIKSDGIVKRHGQLLEYGAI